MKTLKKILLWGGISLLAIVVILIATVQLTWKKKFDAPYPDIKASTDSAVIARGEYIVYGPGHCAECHISQDDYEKVVKGERVPLAGGFTFKLPFGNCYTKNITPDKVNGIGKYSDGEIARVLRYGVKPDGTALIDFMPFYNASDDDLTAIISYIRTLPSSDRKVPANEWNFMGKAMLAFLIKPVGPNGTPPKTVKPDTTAEYGKYLANSISNCRGCHTNRDLKTGAFVGPEYGGGFKMESATMEAGVFCVTPNITTDKDFGRLANWSQQQFIDRFRAGKLIAESPMPWGPFKNFSDNDLKAIYAFLTTMEPVHNDPGPVIVKEGK